MALALSMCTHLMPRSSRACSSSTQASSAPSQAQRPCPGRMLCWTGPQVGGGCIAVAGFAMLKHRVA